MKDRVNAMKDYQNAIRMDPTYSLAYFNAANVYFHTRHFKQVSLIVKLLFFSLFLGKGGGGELPRFFIGNMEFKGGNKLLYTMYTCHKEA